MPIKETIICDCGCATELPDAGMLLTGGYLRFAIVAGIRTNNTVAVPGDRYFVNADHLKTWINSL